MEVGRLFETFIFAGPSNVDISLLFQRSNAPFFSDNLFVVPQSVVMAVSEDGARETAADLLWCKLPT